MLILLYRVIIAKVLINALSLLCENSKQAATYKYYLLGLNLHNILFLI